VQVSGQVPQCGLLHDEQKGRREQKGRNAAPWRPGRGMTHMACSSQQALIRRATPLRTRPALPRCIRVSHARNTETATGTQQQRGMVRDGVQAAAVGVARQQHRQRGKGVRRVVSRRGGLVPVPMPVPMPVPDVSHIAMQGASPQPSLPSDSSEHREPCSYKIACRPAAAPVSTPRPADHPALLCSALLFVWRRREPGASCPLSPIPAPHILCSSLAQAKRARAPPECPSTTWCRCRCQPGETPTQCTRLGAISSIACFRWRIMESRPSTSSSTKAGMRLAAQSPATPPWTPCMRSPPSGHPTMH
jgi:hypothetical protein